MGVCVCVCVCGIRTPLYLLLATHTHTHTHTHTRTLAHIVSVRKAVQKQLPNYPLIHINHVCVYRVGISRSRL